MITQIVEMEVVGPCDHNLERCSQHRIVGEIDADNVFWAYAEEVVDGWWVMDDGIVSYQRDSVAVPNIEYDPDVMAYFAGQGLTKIGDARTYEDWFDLLKYLP
jgi:hypothetical protein